MYVLDGDLIEGVFVVVVMKVGIICEVLKGKFEIICEFLFDLIWKMMSVIVWDWEGKKFIVMKGVLDVFL